EKVKNALDIAQVIGQYVELKPAGTTIKGLCPFHQEKTPSFTVNQTLQIYKCFGCGKGGDVLTFLQAIEGLEFPEALKKGAELAGIELTRTYKKDEALEKLKLRYKEAYTLAAKYYHHLLTNHAIGKSALQYTQKRGLTGKELTSLQFGFAPKGYENLKKFLVSKGFNEQELLDAGLVIQRNNKIIDKFRERLMQPLFSQQGDVIGFSGRYLGSFDKAPKYLNSSESIIYKKHDELYSLYHAKESIRKHNAAIIV